MKNYIPLKVEFCLYESLLCGRVLQQDDRLIKQVGVDNVLIRKDNSPYCICISYGPDLCEHNLYLRGLDKEENDEIFYCNYADKHYAEVALNNFKELIKQVNECFNEADITKNANTYYVEVCE